jgi:hypothetical protein
MLDRQKIETLLARRFPGANLDQVAAAANAIMGLGDEWDEIRDLYPLLDCPVAAAAEEGCHLVEELHRGGELRVFRRKAPIGAAE